MVIYDFGMNNGDDVEYYLKKGHKVVGVEANPRLCEMCSARFRNDVDDGRLTILNVALSDESSEEPLSFFLHKQNHVLSRLETPPPEKKHQFEEVLVRRVTASEVINSHGPPHYVKIDLEGMDEAILRDIFEAGIIPEFISVEAHSIAPFALLVSNGYNAFNLVDGHRVNRIYGEAMIMTSAGRVAHRFPFQSAGPYGTDLVTTWWDADSFLYLLAAEGLGWRDIHASTTIRGSRRTSGIAKYGLKADVRGVFAAIARVRHGPKQASGTSNQPSMRMYVDDVIPSLLRMIQRRLLQ